MPVFNNEERQRVARHYGDFIEEQIDSMAKVMEIEQKAMMERARKWHTEYCRVQSSLCEGAFVGAALKNVIGILLEPSFGDAIIQVPESLVADNPQEFSEKLEEAYKDLQKKGKNGGENKDDHRPGFYL